MEFLCQNCNKLKCEDEKADIGLCYQCYFELNPINHNIKKAYFTDDDWLVWEYEDGIKVTRPPQLIGNSETQEKNWNVRKMDVMHTKILKRRKEI